MKKRISIILTILIILSLSIPVLSGCQPEGGEALKHEHTFFDGEAYEATCIAEGQKTHKYCLYCKSYFIDGNEVEAEDLATAPNPKNHKDIKTVSEIAATCVADGMHEHLYCDDCSKYYTVGGDETTKDELGIISTGEHSFEESSLVCSNADAYKLLYEDDYYIVDDSNRFDFTSNGAGIKHGSNGKQTYFDSIIENKMTFATQLGDASNGDVENTGTEWNITLKAVGVENSFTRFTIGEGTDAYIGRFILTFDVKVAAEAEIGRLGARIVDSTATDTYKSSQSLLLGTNAAEEANSERLLEPGVNYRFMYVMETTASDQIIQVWGCISASMITYSNLQIIELDEKDDEIMSSLLYFGKASDSVLAKADCTHESTYLSADKQSKHCRRCGEDISLIPVGHVHDMVKHNAVTASCYSSGNIEYYHCSDCGFYFSDMEGATPLDENSIFLSAKNHIFNVSGVCTDCSASSITVSPNSQSFGTAGATLNPVLVANPGTWACQTNVAGRASITEGVLSVYVPSGTDKSSTAFTRFIPSINEGESAYVGKYLFVFDFKVTEALGSSSEEAKLHTGFAIQSTATGETGNRAAIAEVVASYTVGKTYRFAVEVGTLNYQQFVQLNIRNSSGSGARFTVSNACLKTYSSETVAENFLNSVAFAQVIG